MSRNPYSFNVNKYTIEFDGRFVAYVNVVDANNIVKQLNRLYCEKLELVKEKEYWKQACLSNDGHVQILENEISIAMEQGYKLSKAYMDYREKRLESIKED